MSKLDEIRERWKEKPPTVCRATQNMELEPGDLVIRRHETNAFLRLPGDIAYLLKIAEAAQDWREARHSLDAATLQLESANTRSIHNAQVLAGEARIVAALKEQDKS
jgi:hypothetical protein